MEGHAPWFQFSSRDVQAPLRGRSEPRHTQWVGLASWHTFLHWLARQLRIANERICLLNMRVFNYWYSFWGHVAPPFEDEVLDRFGRFFEYKSIFGRFHLLHSSEAMSLQRSSWGLTRAATTWLGGRWDSYVNMNMRDLYQFSIYSEFHLQTLAGIPVFRIPHVSDNFYGAAMQRRLVARSFG